MNEIYQTRWPANLTFAEPMSDASLSDVFSAAARNQMLTGNAVSEAASREEAYDRRIEAVRQVTGVTLENPERGGYSIDARKAIRREVLAGGMAPIDEKGGIPAYQKRIFDQKVVELQQKHPDLEFGGLDEESRALAGQSGQDLARAMTNRDLNPLLQYGAEFAGSMWGSRRDPLFLGSLFAGPTSAVGKTALARIASSALNQGLFNSGIAAVEQYPVQQWRAKIGEETGLMPAMQDVGLAFVMGAIPGAVFKAGHEGLKVAAPAVRRLLRGEPQPGDITKAVEALGPKPEAPAMTPEEIVSGAAAPQERAAAPSEPEPLATRAMRAGEESLAADRAVLDEPPPAPSPIHDELVAAALQRADDPEAPSPQATAAVQSITAFHGSPYDFDAFSTGKIGEGEGAQAYGHGLYFAENRDVAADYQKALGGKGVDWSDAQSVAEHFYGLAEGDRSRARDLIAGFRSRPKPGYDKTALAGAQKILEGGAELKAVQPGTLYQVRIHANQDDMLDWDRPLNQQVPKVQEAIRGILKHDIDWNQTGGEFIRSLGSDTIGQNANLMRDAGIPGIKYLDQGSRPSAPGEASPTPTRNFVVFNDKDVEITHKNGEPVNRIDPELQSRIEQANPRNAEEAKVAADQALDDFGRRDGMAELRRQMVEAKALEDETTEAWRADETREKPGIKDIRNKVPMKDRNGNNVMRSERAVSSDGRVDELRADLIRSCK